MGGIRFGGVYRANFSALGLVIETHALYAFFGVYDVRSFTLVDSLNRAFRFTGSAANALICNFVSHVFPPESIIENNVLTEIYKGSPDIFLFVLYKYQDYKG